MKDIEEMIRNTKRVNRDLYDKIADALRWTVYFSNKNGNSWFDSKNTQNPVISAVDIAVYAAVHSAVYSAVHNAVDSAIRDNL